MNGEMKTNRFPKIFANDCARRRGMLGIPESLIEDIKKSWTNARANINAKAGAFILSNVLLMDDEILCFDALNIIANINPESIK